MAESQTSCTVIYASEWPIMLNVCVASASVCVAWWFTVALSVLLDAGADE